MITVKDSDERRARALSLVGESVSKGTLDTRELIGSLVATLVVVEGVDSTLSTGALKFLEGLRDTPELVDPYDGSLFIEELIDALDGYSPDGHYFGSHPGDDSDFGYWESPDRSPTGTQDDEPAIGFDRCDLRPAITFGIAGAMLSVMVAMGVGETFTAGIVFSIAVGGLWAWMKPEDED